MGNGWSKVTTQIAVGLMLVGFVLMALAFNEASSHGAVARQIPPLISGTIPGLALVIVGATLAIVQEIRRSTGTIAAQVRELATSVHAAGSTGLTEVPLDGTAVVAGRTTYHDPECRLVRDREDRQFMSVEDAVDRGLAPCRICEPSTAAQIA